MSFMISNFSQITQDEFYTKIIALGATIVTFLLYLAVRFMISGKNSLISAQAMEYKLVKSGDIKIEELQLGNWSVNADMVMSFGSFSLGTLILAAVFIFEQELISYDKWMFNLIIIISVIAVLGYFLGLQFWFLALDQGENPETLISFRQTATLFQTVGWTGMIFAAIVSVMAISTLIGIISCVLFFLSMVFMYERKYVILKRQKDLIKKNSFQESLSIQAIYTKGDREPEQLKSRDSLRLMTWNIERGYHPDQIATTINRYFPDIVCLQEVDWGNLRTNQMDVLGYLSEHTSMRGFLGLEFYELDSPYRSETLMGGGVHGNAILTRVKPTEIFRVEIPQKYDWEDPPEGMESPARVESRIGNRFALCANFKINDKDLIVGSLHIEDKFTSIEDRWEQFKTLAEVFQDNYGTSSQQVIAGDFNTISNFVSRFMLPHLNRQSPEIRLFETECKYWKGKLLPPIGFSDPFSCKDWTYKKSFLYQSKLDWITTKNINIRDWGRGNFNSSDHRPLWVDLEI